MRSRLHFLITLSILLPFFASSQQQTRSDTVAVMVDLPGYVSPLEGNMFIITIINNTSDTVIVRKDPKIGPYDDETADIVYWVEELRGNCFWPRLYNTDPSPGNLTKSRLLPGDSISYSRSVLGYVWVFSGTSRVRFGIEYNLKGNYHRTLTDWYYLRVFRPKQ